MKLRIFFYSLAFLFFKYCSGGHDFTNIICKSYDPEFIDFPVCEVKTENKTIKYLTLRAHLPKRWDNVELNIMLMKATNGVYKNYLFNYTVDGCKLLESPSANLAVNFFFNAFRKYTNLNHTCPYENDVIIDRVDVGMVSTKLAKGLPIPPADYALFTSWTVSKKLRSTVRVYGTFS